MTCLINLLPDIFLAPLRPRYEDLSDREVLEHAQSGCRAAQEYLLYKYRSLVRARVKSYFLVGAEREDLIQVGMIGLWQAVVEYQPGKASSFAAFAKVCIHRNIISAINTATRQKQAPLNSSLSFEVPSDDGDEDWDLAERLPLDHTLDPEELLLQREDNRAREAMLRRLLSEFEWSVLSGYQMGKSYQEIAEELGCRPKSIDNALARIKRKIHEAKAADPNLTLEI